MIPRRFFWLSDLTILVLTYLLAMVWVPSLQHVMASRGYLEAGWLSFLSPTLEPAPEPIVAQLWILVVAVLPTIIVLDICGNGKWMFQSLTRIILSGPLSSIVASGFISLIPLALRNPPVRLSRLLLFTSGMLSAIALSGYRMVMRAYYRRRKEAGYYVRNVLVVGLESSITWVSQYFDENISSREYRILGSLEVQNHRRPASTASRDSGTILGLQTPAVLGHVSQLGDFLIHKPIHEVIAIQPASGGEWMSRVIRDCDNLGILLRIVPEALICGQTVRLQTLFPLQTLHLPAVVLSPPHLDSDALFVKRVFDVFISFTLLLILSPLFAAIALLIKLTTPKLTIFYPWHVVGRNGVRFTGYKFTTMVADADQQKAELLQRNEMSGPVFKLKNDPRVTPLGKILRRFDFNELPQLWSVLKGDMSLVGPRPAGPHELERYDFWQKRKLSIRPGITCLWQVRGRNKICDFEDWVKMDLEYIDNWSLWLDLKILVRTVFVVLSGTGS